ncbi:MAG: ABC transporter permease subunit [Planctomycetes bacterium]|nr:ABC transporter permease subunit [Planctomycetota bacterium]
MAVSTEPPSETTRPVIDADRFRTARATLIVDGFMTWFIKVGGLVIIIAVFGIFVFILLQILPLFQGAKVGAERIVSAPAGAVAAFGIDEWGEMPFVVYRDGGIFFAGSPGETPLMTGGPIVTASAYNVHDQRLVMGTSTGSLAVATIGYEPEYGAQGRRTLKPSAAISPSLQLGDPGAALVSVAYADTGDDRLAAAVQEVDGQRRLWVATVEAGGGLSTDGALTLGSRVELTAELPGVPERVLVDNRADSVIVTTTTGSVCYFFRRDGHFEKRQFFVPFEDQPDHRVASIDFLLGDVSLVLTNPAGCNRIFSLHHRDGGEIRTFGQTKELALLPAGCEHFGASTRNKAYLATAGTTASLRYATTAHVRWERDLGYAIRGAVINSKYDRLAFIDDRNAMHLMPLSDPHPEAGFQALFDKVWYEGASEPRYEWQSSGGSDDFEPKLSMINLLVGTLKGTFYALLFAVPIAVLGAMYTAEFMHPKFRSVVKPTVEIMASLPSVVLGFLAAQWLAPVLEMRVPSVLMVILLVPTTAIALGSAWSRLPMSMRSRIRPGYEFLAFVPVLLAVCWAGWELGPLLERLVFTVPDPHGSGTIADFRRWWPRVTGCSFEQRNSLVVGFMMGFAVIPIIFTIAEDALSNVPKNMRSGSLALGASRWQTAYSIVLPTASAGIFSALMIGVGRAIGETMIVVMATGNTPILDFNIFNGMRTLSANIAVELPEASEGGTLYRTLFLGAMLLFGMTFIINTVAELLRQHLREKYRTV